LADSLVVVAPSVPTELVSAGTVRRLTAVAGTLPPIHRAGFECRLRAGDDRVDFQQGIPASDGETARLAAFLEESGELGAAWERVKALARRSATPGDFVHETVSELWVELDLATAAGPQEWRPDPSVFAVLRPSGADRGLAAARAVLETLLGEEQARLLERVTQRLQRECAGRARISHIGVMLGRPSAALRVHISDIQLQDLSGYLRRIGWEGDTVRTQALGRMLLDYTDLLVLCLDVVGELTPRLGLECFFAQRTGVDPRWRPLLEHLVALGMCAEEKADALLRWPGRVTPVDDLVGWPADLIVRSLTRPPDLLGVIERRLSHLKVTCAPDVRTEVKAYFGYGHLWLPAREDVSRPRYSRRVRSARTAEIAIAAAVERLLQMRNQAGWWRDFFDRARPADAEHRVIGYASDEWVTAFVGAALAPAPAEGARDAADEALALLLARRDGAAGWGYHALLPADADTTTWVLRLARSLGEPERGRLAAGRDLIEGLTGPDGGVATYPEDAAAPLARFLGMGGSYAGWCAPHTCVTAAAAVLGIAPTLVPYLHAAQRADGSWAGHWWDDDEYATARAVEALAGSAAGGRAVGAAVAWCCERIGRDGAVRSAKHGGPSPFATALALHAIRIGGSERDWERWRPAADRAEGWLLEHQLEDGRWEPSARLRVPAPSAREPDESPELNLSYVDDQGAFTTATVLAALSARRL
jgi:squalene-hopene/tetraprenyl-beta-curcumene cyclase